MNNYSLEDIKHYIQNLIDGEETTKDGLCVAIHNKFYRYI